MDMNKVSVNLLLLLGVMVCICLAGRMDYTEEVVHSMSDATYAAIKEELGDVSDGEVADAYMADKARWDSIGYERWLRGD